MSSIQIKRVETKKDLKRFIEFHYDLYKGNPYDVPNLYSDEVNTLSKNKNAAFDFCEAEYYLALKEGKIVGRVAAIINHKANEKWKKKDVRFGWIDFIDDIEVSRALFEAVEEYGRKKGMNDIVGPLGFTDMDPEGMLTWGFDKLGTMATIYNYEYYPQHMEKLGGWEKDNDYVEYYLVVPEKSPEKYTKIAEMVEKRYNLHVRKLTKKDIFQGGYGKKLFDLINLTYSDLYGFSELTDRQIDQYVKETTTTNYADAKQPLHWDYDSNSQIYISYRPDVSPKEIKFTRGQKSGFDVTLYYKLKDANYPSTKVEHIMKLNFQGTIPKFISNMPST